MSRSRLITERWKTLPPTIRRLTPLILILIIGMWLGNVLFSERAPHRTTAEAGNESAVEVWTCSMHPQVRSHEPGNCPICGMGLIPVQSGGGHAHSSMEQVSMSEHAAALMQVQVRPVERRSVEGSVSVNGRIEFDERQVRDVVVRTEGQIEQLYVNYTLAPVQQGQRLAEIYSPAILAASQELLNARRSGLTELVDAARSQLPLLGISEEQIAAIETSGEPMRTYTLFSPVGGVITDLTARQGEWLDAGSQLMRVGSVGQVWAIFDVYESDLRNVRSGQSVRSAWNPFPARRSRGQSPSSSRSSTATAERPACVSSWRIRADGCDRGCSLAVTLKVRLPGRLRSSSPDPRRCSPEIAPSSTCRCRARTRRLTNPARWFSADERAITTRSPKASRKANWSSSTVPSGWIANSRSGADAV